VTSGFVDGPTEARRRDCGRGDPGRAARRAQPSPHPFARERGRRRRPGRWVTHQQPISRHNVRACN
jgi:hypothetical protein